MSIGIIAFAYIAMIGLLPAGLSQFGKAIDNSLGSQILQRIVNEAQQTDYDTLTATPVSQRYFDNEGKELPTINGSIYTAEVTVVAPTSLPNTSTAPSTNLVTLTIRLVNNPGGNSTPFAPGTKLRIRTHTALIAKK